MTTVNISCCRIHTIFKLHCTFSLVIEKYLETEAQWNSSTVFVRMCLEKDFLTYVRR